MVEKLTAKEFIKRLEAQKSSTEQEKYKRYFKNSKDDVFIGVRMGQVFALAKEFSSMDLSEVEKLFESKIHEVRIGAVSILDFLARSKKTSEEKRKELYDLYLKKHNRINDWDLVDRAAIYVIGGYLFDKPRDILYKLAKSKNMWERRTAIVSTAYFMKKGEVEDTLKISEILLNDKEDLIHKATGWMLRVAGDVDRKELLKFLDKHTTKMPRTALRYALEHFDKKKKDKYMKMKV